MRLTRLIHKVHQIRFCVLIKYSLSTQVSRVCYIKKIRWAWRVTPCVVNLSPMYSDTPGSVFMPSQTHQIPWIWWVNCEYSESEWVLLGLTFRLHISTYTEGFIEYERSRYLCSLGCRKSNKNSKTGLEFLSGNQTALFQDKSCSNCCDRARYIPRIWSLWFWECWKDTRNF